MNFDEAFERLMEHEGGYSNHKDDPGGETMFGITKAVARVNGYTGDMANFPKDLAKGIYRRQYWDAVRADFLPNGVRFDVFDGAVNSGVTQSVKWLQRAAGAKDDGVIGPLTLKAAQANSANLAGRYNGHRLAYLADLNNFNTFGRGWSRRIASNLKALNG